MAEYIMKIDNPITFPYSHQEIVRCRDCKFFATDNFGDYCSLFDFEDVKGMANRFCAWAKRKEG